MASPAAILRTSITLLLMLQSSQVLDHGKVKRQVDVETPVVFPTMFKIPENRCVAYDSSNGTCRPAPLCVFRFESVGDFDSACIMSNGKVGVCCPGKPPPSRTTGSNRPEHPINMPDISTIDLDSAGQEGRSIVQRIENLEVELQRRGLTVQRGSPEYYLDAQFDGNRDKVWRIGRDGLIGVEATLRLARTFQLSSVQGSEGLSRFSLQNTVIGYTCPKASPCPTMKYRTSDGSCNNLAHPDWGKAFHTYSRVLPPRYSDGINEPRASYDGGPLPGAREVSSRVNVDRDRPSKKTTVAFTVWAQFLAYDLSLTAVSLGGRGHGILCCHPEIQKTPGLLHPACLPIHVPDNDPYFRKYGVSCMQFLRSIAAPRSDCKFGPREQLNQVTSFIDGSSIYGTSDNATKILRSHEGGKLKGSRISDEEMLPRKANVPCASTDTPCFATGDTRSNQNPLLTVMHGLMLREHNRIADKLSRLNRGWNDEILYRESRRVLVAEIQHITYTEFLPLLLGTAVMSSYRLTAKSTGYSFDYDPDLNPAIINAFAAAANRFGHSLVQSRMEKYSAQGRMQDDQQSASFDPESLYDEGSFDALLRGTLRQPAQAFDVYVSKHLTNELFGIKAKGMDLMALNIQRGRDHGLPGYNEWLEYCGSSRLRSFEDLSSVVDPLVARNFSRLYRNVDDVDLYAAGIAENPLPEGILGPTFACIVAEQFRRLKFGDRFWYENGGMESSFTEAQLQEIRKASLARLLCDNSNIDAIQLVGFLKPSHGNPTEDCRTGNIPKVNLAVWINEPVWT